MKALPIAAAVLMLPIPAGATFKCVDSAGKTTYQEVPCAPSASTAKVLPNSHQPSEADRAAAISRAARDRAAADAIEERDRRLEETRAAAARSAAADIERRDRLESHARSGRVAIGQTGEQVVQAWGQPTTINQSIRAGSVSEQWVYRVGRSSAQYVYLENGVVTAIQGER